MSETTTPPAANPTPGAPESSATATPAPPAQPNPSDSGDAFKSEESKNAVLADLAKERDARQALEARLDAQNKALGAALGLSEDPKPGDDLAETVKSLQEQFAASQLEAMKLRVASEKNIPADYHDLLTETDPEKLKAQAEKVGALVAANAAASQPPAFQPNPGQGQGGAPLSDEAKAAAEYERFYPNPNAGK